LSRPTFSRFPSAPQVRINGKIRAREVRVIGADGQQLGVLPLGDAIRQAQVAGVDLVEIAPNAVPPVCRLVDFGKYKYELSKKEKDSRKHQHANKVKEIQLSATIDPHDFKTKLSHAVDFLCEDMKVKINLRFRGREMAHTEFGFQVVNKFVTDVAPWGHPDFAVKLVGRSINLMISPLPRNKRAKHPSGEEPGAAPPPKVEATEAKVKVRKSATVDAPAANTPPEPSFSNNPFDAVNLPADSSSQ
jgi:translation initiation factor IF-3